jgi:hypothetical protein
VEVAFTGIRAKNSRIPVVVRDGVDPSTSGFSD